MTVRAKFTFTGYETGLTYRYPRDAKGVYDYQNGKPVELRTLKFAPVSANNDPNHENSKFWDASPSGQMTLGTVNPEAWSQFELGKSYYLDFVAAD